MKTFKIFMLLVVGLCILMYALVDFSHIFVFPIFWLIWICNSLDVPGLGAGYYGFPTFFGIAIILLGTILSLVGLYFLAKLIAKKGKKQK